MRNYSLPVKSLKHKERGAALKRDLADKATPTPFSILLYTARNLLSFRTSEWCKARSFENSLSTQTQNKTYKCTIPNISNKVNHILHLEHNNNLNQSSNINVRKNQNFTEKYQLTSGPDDQGQTSKLW